MITSINAKSILGSTSYPGQEIGVPAMQTRQSMVNTAVAANHLGLSVSTLNKWRLTGQGPHYFKFGRAVRYGIADLAKWVEQQRAISTSGHLDAS
jgi:predicted DNA-binding transcriptional regulator AlpA